MGKKIILTFVFLLFLFPLISGAPSFQQSTIADLQIEYSKIDIIQANQTHNFHFQVSNKTDFLDNSTTQCGFVLTNPNGFVQFEDVSIDFLAGTLNQFEINITENNFTKPGEYSYYIQCNTSSQSGFSSIPIKVTYSGIDFTTAQSVSYTGLFAIMIFIFLINFFGLGLLPGDNKRDEEGKLMQISYLKYIRSVLWLVQWALLVGILFVASNIAFIYLQEQLVAQFFFVLFRITMGLTPIIFIVWGLAFYAKFLQDREFKKLFTRGFSSGARKL